MTLSDSPRAEGSGRRCSVGSRPVAHHAVQHVEDHLVVPMGFAGDADFALTVHGDSMVDAGILDGTSSS